MALAPKPHNNPTTRSSLRPDVLSNNPNHTAQPVDTSLRAALITQRSVVQIHPPQPLTDLRDYWRSPQFQNHWIVAVSGLKFFRETSFALSFSCFLIAGGKTRSATRLLARRLDFSNAEP